MKGGVVKLFVMCMLLGGGAPYAQAQSGRYQNDPALCGVYINQAADLVVAFHTSGQSNFQVFVEEQRRNEVGKASKEFGSAVGGIKGFIIGRGASAVARGKFEKSVKILEGLGFYRSPPPQIRDEASRNNFIHRAGRYCLETPL